MRKRAKKEVQEPKCSKMSDEEESQLTDEEKIEIAKWFLLNSPVGEIQYVAKDVREVLKDDRVYRIAAAEAFPLYNKSHVICLEFPNRSGEVCTGSRPANDDELPSSYIEEYCCVFDAEIIKYVSEAYPKGICCVYCTNGKDMEEPGSNFEFVVVISASRLSAQNFWRVETCQVTIRHALFNFTFLVYHLLVAVLHHIMHLSHFIVINIICYPVVRYFGFREPNELYMFFY